MTAVNIALGVAAGLAAIAAVVGSAAWLNRRRREAWREAALAMGLAFSPDGGDLVARCGRFRLFQVGRDRRASNVLEGQQWGGHAVIADYRYTTGSGKSSKLHAQTVCLLKLAGMHLPNFVLRREGLGDRIAQALLGAEDIDFAGDQPFSRQWVLRGDDEEAVRALFCDTLRQTILHAPALPGYVEGGGDSLLVHDGRRIRPDTARELVLQAQSVVGLLREVSAGR